ncbi:F0F1 ATP synthase subunit A [Eremococcus coleocola]|uniref:ATP synthase subunit a n=1 Tax=Eremococcus coleocola ACS-139-V-Col8 TaxID=908337 RepID=E4KQS3_9LACT|nr:F0F1 ATP synthase subunit A [Eremococcus coleocola]EFR30762.1 ATP synthase F0, A subunit [Eremococcus coleocola ACS-139-V-Col8]
MFQIEQVSILIVSLIIIMFIFWLKGQFKAIDQGQKQPSKIIVTVISYVQMIDNLVKGSMGPAYTPKMSAYIGTIFIYIFISNISGLFAINNPTGNLSVTLTLAIITWILVERTKFKSKGIKGFIKSFFEPFPFFVIPNLFSEVAPLVSLSMRLFGNILSGSIIMGLFYVFTAWLASFIPVVGHFNFIGAVLAPVLHAYFDLFAGFLQSFIFITLTTVLIAVEHD